MSTVSPVSGRRSAASEGSSSISFCSAEESFTSSFSCFGRTAREKTAGRAATFEVAGVHLAVDDEIASSDRIEPRQADDVAGEAFLALRAVVAADRKEPRDAAAIDRGDHYLLLAADPL
ncbi:MAG: hypothetical protein HC850_18100 [Rhodomicrobium sp.]|nr:hypothetical protein [Rhodomicrobium sp.]